VHIIGFLVGIVLFVGGIVIMGYSFEPLGFMLPFGFDPRSVLFFGGILVSSAGLAVPFHVMKRIDG
jgi:ABC-type antimicrobial peptide transport system permease subunit